VYVSLSFSRICILYLLSVSNKRKLTSSTEGGKDDSTGCQLVTV